MAILFCHLFFCIKKSELVAFFFGGYFPTAPCLYLREYTYIPDSVSIFFNIRSLFTR